MSAFNPSQVEHLQAIGTYLRQTREGQSLSLEQVAAQTYIRLPILKALEAGQAEQLPEPVYVRGFIRRYSQLLQVDGESLLQELVQRQAAEETVPNLEAAEHLLAPPTPQSTELEDISPLTEVREIPPLQAVPSLGAGLKPYLAYLLLAAGVGVGAFYFLSRPPAPESPSPASPSPAASPSSPLSSPSPTPPAAGAADSLTATVTLDGSSWVQVEADGKTQFVGTLTEGAQKTWSAKKQLILQVGNAGAVNLSVNQEAARRLGNTGEVKKVVLSP